MVGVYMKKGNVKYKKPNPIVYKCFYWASSLLCKFKFNLKYLRNEVKDAKGPFVVIANHEASIDFISVAAAVKRRIHFVISNSFYESLSIQPLLKSAGVIPKNQYQTMVEDLKKMKLCIDNGMPIAIFPAGLMSADGITMPIPASTGKSLKWFDQDVYVAKSSGSYLTCPKWSKKMRKGQMTIDVYKLFTKEQLREMNEKDVQKEIEKALYYDAYQNQLNNPVAYKNGDDIVGFENVLYQCPSCKKEFTMAVENKSTIKCSNCGYEATADVYGFFNKSGENEVYKLPSEWYAMIVNELKKVIDNTENYTLKDECEVYKINKKKHKFEKSFDALITLDSEKFTLSGDINGEDFYKEFSTAIFPTLPFSPGKYFELQEKKDVYRIYLKNGREVTKWIIALKIFFENRLNSKNQ